MPLCYMCCQKHEEPKGFLPKPLRAHTAGYVRKHNNAATCPRNVHTQASTLPRGLTL